MAKTIYQRFWEKVAVKSPNECWPWTANKHRDGYGKFELNYKTLGSHRVAFEFVGGVIPDGFLICHTCDNPPCCNPNHLYAGTVTDNNRDTVKRGHYKARRGEDAPRSVLTNAEVLDIRQRAKNGEKRLGRKFGVNKYVIYSVVHRRTWRHI